MPTRSHRIGVAPYFQYAWTGRTAFSLGRPAHYGELVKYRLSPSCEWKATRRAVTLRFKASKAGAISWSLA